MSEGKKEILLGDCLELMKDIPNGSIDMILADLPYGTTACKWDSIIDLDLLWKQYKRIIKDNGAIVLTASQPFTTKLISSNYGMFRYEWIWQKDKPNNFALANRMPMKYHENICVFYSKQPTYNKQMEPRTGSGRDRYKYVVDNSKRTSDHMTLNDKPKFYDPELKNPSSVQFVSTGRRQDLVHPTQKPVALMEYLIKTYTNEGELVLDNTAGSGTTAIACLKTNRQFIVMEKEKKYYDIILKRVADFNKNPKQLTLFGDEM